MNAEGEILEDLLRDVEGMRRSAGRLHAGRLRDRVFILLDDFDDRIRGQRRRLRDPPEPPAFPDLEKRFPGAPDDF